MNFMFSAKELDRETGFYYYGARYLDPKYSRWISCDPAMNTGEYFPVAPVDDEAKKHNGNLPGMGGIFNHINGNLYHYAGNNPIRYIDPDGRDDDEPKVYGRVDPKDVKGQFVFLSVSKSTGIMDVYVSRSEDGSKVDKVASFSVITNVQSGTPDNSNPSDKARTQGNGTNPTQVANGIYEVTEARAPSTGEGKYGTGKQGLYVNVAQDLLVQEGDNKGEYVKDSGYMVHITPWDYTSGCIGFKYKLGDEKSKQEALYKQMMLVSLYEDMKAKGGKTYIEYRD